ncbi:Putative Mss4-like superfamily protein [Septoria linicola]|uniref:Mss4-like superfamily protein n=1 Tax=Septoria linicola TaxID=215465 RepID=A0A9Q9ANX4_9PEZI|nr:Putative Mss4-like superfamily protein [Septoria linicola]
MPDQELPSKPPWPEETGIWATYPMHCHCGAIRYNMKISPPLFEEQAEGKGVYPVTSCNCSYCERTGYLTVHPRAENVTFTRGK